MPLPGQRWRFIDWTTRVDQQRAVSLLIDLADGSPAFLQSLELLKLLEDGGATLDPAAGNVSARLARAHEAIDQREDQRLGTLRPALATFGSHPPA